MIQELFFPQMTRSVYETKRTGDYYQYTHYRAAITSDCKERCAYCDISLSESGHEGFHLDHFRPQKKFPNKINDPYNLVLSCPACNGRKLDHWPLPDNAPPHDRRSGFLDPFTCNRSDFFLVQNDGSIVATGGPAPYLVKLLDLDRTSKRKARLHRIICAKIDILFIYSEKLLDELLRDIANQEPHVMLGEKLQAIMDIQKNLKSYINEIHST